MKNATTKHTPGIAKFFPSHSTAPGWEGFIGEIKIPANRDHHDIYICEVDGGESPENAKANAERIVALWNASAPALSAEITALKAQNTELVRVLRHCEIEMRMTPISFESPSDYERFRFHLLEAATLLARCDGGSKP